ncbi:acyl-CoA thioesterase [Isoalcanivorax indicus]|uniref:acyl-CoA thioesterase n=1 Tax=Isoalcanivorax indicus TaxID=2202653 RepID=UPI000DBAB41E|nr:thioesterase family protein [Isoalcanivorax indicus]
MHCLTLTPRFYETDAFGHINNTVVAGWFETGRATVFELFAEADKPAVMPLILARIEVDFVGQIYYGAEVEIRTRVGELGNSSFEVLQEAWQKGALVARGRAVQVHFDHATQRSAPLSDDKRRLLEGLR